MERSALSALLIPSLLAACVTAPAAPPSAPPPPSPPIARPAPDLAVESAGCRNGEIGARVVNRGRTYAAPFRVVVRTRAGEPLAEWAVKGLAEEDVREFRFAAMPGLVYTVVADPDGVSEDPNPTDNIARLSCGGSDRPDLAVSDATCAGDRIYVQVVNRAAAAGPFTVFLRDPEGRTAARWEVAGLSRGAVRGFTHTRQADGTFRLLVDPFDAAGDADRANNEAAIGCGGDGSGRQTDLVVEGASCRNGRLTATIRNAGAAPAPAFDIGLRSGGGRAVNERRSVPGLHPGGGTVVTFGPLPAGRHEIEVDPDRATPDVYRGNNAAPVRCGFE